MSNVKPLALDDIADPELREIARRCDEELGVPDSLFVRVIARASTMAVPTMRMLLQSHYEGNVPHRLKELIRLQLAQFCGDPYFSALRSKKAVAEGMTEAEVQAALGDYDDSPLFTEAEKWLMRYGDQLYLDAEKVDRAFYDSMRRYWSDAEIMEVGSFIGFHYAALRFTATLNARPLAQGGG